VPAHRSTHRITPAHRAAGSNVDAASERVRAIGAEVLQEPIDQPWGPRDCAFRDPSGTMVRISQAPKA
jgi:uncharacterized glyoxalase superfamily protein PhnB